MNICVISEKKHLKDDIQKILTLNGFRESETDQDCLLFVIRIMKLVFIVIADDLSSAITTIKRENETMFKKRQNKSAQVIRLTRIVSVRESGST